MTRGLLLVAMPAAAAGAWIDAAEGWRLGRVMIAVAPSVLARGWWHGARRASRDRASGA